MTFVCSLIPGIFLAGRCAGILSGWFRSGKALMLSAVLTISAASGSLFAVLMERNTYAAPMFSLVSVLLGGLVFMEKSPRLQPESRPIQVSDRHRHSLKIVFFAAVTGFAAVFSWLNMPSDMPFDFFLSPGTLFTAGLIAGPWAAGLISDNRSVYNGAIFIIFLAEISAACAVHGGSTTALMYLGQLTSGMLLAGLPVVIPLLAFYLSGPAGFRTCLFRACGALCIGAFIAVAVSSAFFYTQYMASFVFILLILSFFTVFSAWKHRLFLLKYREI